MGDEKNFDAAVEEHTRKLAEKKKLTAETKQKYWKMTTEERNNDENTVEWKKILRKLKKKRTHRKE